jgi:aminoglycoside phosphotransferase (APT) family kinase protein
MAAETASFDWLQQPGLAGRRLAAAGLVAATDLPLGVDKAWPYRDDGWLARAQGRNGSWWGLASLTADDVPRPLRLGVRQGTVRYLDKDNVLAWRFDDDPALALDLRAPAAATDSRGSASSQAPWPASERVLGYKPLHRCVLRSGLPGDWIAKLYGGHRDARAAETYAQLGDSDAAGPAFIPRPEQHDRPRRTLRWRASPGETLLQSLSSQPRPELLRQAAEVIAHLHGHDARWVRRHTPDDELATAGRWARFAARVSPALHDRLEQALDGLRATAAKLQAGPYVPSHRDFYDKQILVDGERSALLDLDMACLAEPELDLGNFLAHLHLRELQGSLSGAGPLSIEFTRHYWAIGGAIEPQRLEFYEACAHLRLACVYLVRPQWTGLAGRLLDSTSPGH